MVEPRPGSVSRGCKNVWLGCAYGHVTALAVAWFVHVVSYGFSLWTVVHVVSYGFSLWGRMCILSVTAIAWT